MTTCKTCLERRREIMQAWQEKKIAEAVRLVALGAAELVGMKKKESPKQ